MRSRCTSDNRTTLCITQELSKPAKNMLILCQQFSCHVCCVLYLEIPIQIIYYYLNQQRTCSSYPTLFPATFVVYCICKYPSKCSAISNFNRFMFNLCKKNPTTNRPSLSQSPLRPKCHQTLIQIAAPSHACDQVLWTASQQKSR